MISEFTLETTFGELIQSERVVFLDFYTTWCEPCKWLDSILVDVDKRVEIPVLFLKIDAEKHPELARKYQIMSAPVSIILMNNEAVWRMNGFLAADELIEKLREISRETPE